MSSRGEKKRAVGVKVQTGLHEGQGPRTFPTAGSGSGFVKAAPQVQFRLTVDEREELEAAARARSVSVSDEARERYRRGSRPPKANG